MGDKELRALSAGLIAANDSVQDDIFHRVTQKGLFPVLRVCASLSSAFGVGPCKPKLLPLGAETLPKLRLLMHEIEKRSQRRYTVRLPKKLHY